MRLIALAAAFALVALPAAARPFELADIWKWKTAGSAQISPDGRRVIYRVTEVDAQADAYDGDPWIMNADGSGQQPFGDGSGHRWSPDGRHVAYVDSHGGASQVMVREMAGAGEARAVTTGALSPSQPTWSPDGRWIAFLGRVPRAPDDFAIEMPPAPAGAKRNPEALVVRDLTWRGMTGTPLSGRRHIFVVPATGGEARQLTHGDWDVGARYGGVPWGTTLAWTPDGRGIVFDGLTRPEALADWRFSDINRVEVATGALSRLNPEPGFWTSPTVSPDGRQVAYTGFGDNPSTWAPRELRVAPTAGGAGRALIADLPDEASFIRWAADGRGLFYTANTRGETNLHHVSLAGRDRPVTTGAQRLFIGNIGGRYAVATMETTRSPYEVARIDLSTGEVKPLTAVSAEALAGVDLATTERFDFQAPDGQALQGWLVKPPGFDPARRYPLILDIHGGPHSLYGEGFDARYQDFAAKGYLVLYTNPRGSTGYGSAFAAAIDQAFPGDLDSGDLLAGVDAAIAKGFVDPARLFVMGCSGGGSLTAWLTARTRRFKAAAVMCPVTDWISQAGTSDAAGWSNTRFARPFWEDPAPYLAHSPLMQVGKVETPTLVMVGDKDFRTPAGQAEQYYSALRLRGVPTRLVVIRNETHQPWKGVPSNLIRTQLYVRAWFARYGGIADAAR